MRSIIVKLMFIMLPIFAVAKGKNKDMVISRVEANLSASEVEKILDKQKSHKIETINWEEFSYMPKVKFAMVHDGDHIYIKYYVKEKETMARQGEDFGRIWTDSCVEMFIMFDGEHYYNFEFNSIGNGLASRKVFEGSSEDVDRELFKKIERFTTMGNQVFEQINGDNQWTLMLKIPVELFSRDGITTFDGAQARANFYKCGDDMTTPHFVSWAPIDTPSPSFHQPKFFRTITFE